MPNGVCDPLSDSYDVFACGTAPPITGSFGFISGGGGTTNVDVTVTTPPISVTVATPPTFPTTIINGVGKVITDAIAALGVGLGNTLSSLNLLTVIAINQAVSGMGQVVADAIKGLGTAISNLNSVSDTALSNITSAINVGLTPAVVSIAKALTTSDTDINKSLTTLNTTFTTAFLSANASVFLGLVPAVTDIGTKLNQLHLDVINPLTGLVAIPVAISGGLERVHDVLFTGLGRLNFQSGAEITTDLKFPDTALDPVFVASVWAPLIHELETGEFKPAFGDLIKLAENCPIPDPKAAMDEFYGWLKTAPGWLKSVATYIEKAFAFVIASAGVLQKQIELANEVAELQCPIKKLSPSDLIAAWVRKYITPADLFLEMRKQGIDTSRTTVLQQLASAQMDTPTLISAYWQGMLSRIDLELGLNTRGYSADQINLILNTSAYLPSLQDALHWWNWKEITEDQLNIILAQNRFSGDQISHIKKTMLQRETTVQYMNLDGRLAASLDNYPGVTLKQEMSQAMKDAALRDGLIEGNAQLQWVAHWAYPSYKNIITSYFRGMRSITEVYRAMTAENIPHEFWDEQIELARPILSFRTIPNFLKAGLMTPGDATAALRKLGYHDDDIVRIIAYALKSLVKIPSAAVSGIAALSISNARTMFDEGLITREQYVDVLKAHKYPDDLADAQATADELAYHVKQQKQAITDFIDEVNAGLLTVDDAITQMHQQGFTDLQIARFQKGLRKASVSKAKHPTIPEMKAFYKAQLITLDQFRTELQLQGWADPWLSAFVALETIPSDQSTGNGTTPTTPIGGNPQPQPIPGQGDGTIRS